MKLTLKEALRRWHYLMSLQATPSSKNRTIDTLRRYLLSCGRWKDIYAYDQARPDESRL